MREKEKKKNLQHHSFNSINKQNNTISQTERGSNFIRKMNVSWGIHHIENIRLGEGGGEKMEGGREGEKR